MTTLLDILIDGIDEGRDVFAVYRGDITTATFAVLRDAPPPGPPDDGGTV